MLADAEAKRAAAGHPAFDLAGCENLEWESRVAKSVLTLEASLLPLWPRVELGVERAPPPPVSSAPRPEHR